MRLLLVPRVVFNLCIDGDFYVEGTVIVVLDMLAFGIENAALPVAVDLDALLANFADGIGLIGVGVDVEDRVAGVGRVRAGSPGTGSGGVGTRV